MTGPYFVSSFAALVTAFFIATGSAQAAPIFPPVGEGFVGTPFRGVALGQTRDEVEAALAIIGKRCATEAEVSPGRTNEEKAAGQKLYVESYDGYTTCRIVEAAKVNIPYKQVAMGMFWIELSFGMPVYAVSFFDGRAAAISLTPEYFNAGGATPYSFAQSIIDNYPVQSLEPTDSGWRGVSDKGELVQIWRGSAAIPLWLTVFLADDTNAPAFN